MERTTKKATVITLSAFAILLAAAGCNRGDGGVASKRSGSGVDLGARTAPVHGVVPASTAPIRGTAVGAPMEVEQAPRGDETEVTPAGYLPPDIAASVTEIVATPGSIVEIEVEGSDDVVAMTLSDGGRTETAFRFDESAGLWRASYRMPLRPKTDRIGLSVTARNASQRWRRVWVFVKASREVAAADSTSGC
jgi:hypothetical protein